MTNDNPKSNCCGAETMINMDLYEFKCGKCGKTCKLKPSPYTKCVAYTDKQLKQIRRMERNRK